MTASAAVLGFHHAQITVPPGEAERVRWFYGQVLGLAEIEVPASLAGRGLIWFRLGQRELHVGVEPHADRLGTFAHLAYEVRDLPEYRRRLAELGIRVIEQPRIPGYDRIHLRDPFGNRVELIEKMRED